jgi:hypothetical protein
VLAGWGAPVAGPCHGTDGDPTEPGPGHCSCKVRPVSLSAAKSAHMVLQCSDNLDLPTARRFDDDVPVRHHALLYYEFVCSPLPTPLLLRQLGWRSPC